MLILLITLAFFGVASKGPVPATALTKADIPADLSPEVKRLVEKTFSGDPTERRRSAERLGEMGDRAAPAVPFLIRLLRDNAYTEGGDPLRISAQVALKKIGEPAVAPCLAVLKRSSGQSRRAIIPVIGGFKDPRAIDALTDLLSDPAGEIRRTAMLYLDSCTDPRAAVPIARCLKDDYYEVATFATWNLRNIHDPRVVDPLIVALKGKSSDVAKGAAEALGEQRDRRAEPALLEVLGNAKNDVLAPPRGSVALGKINGPHGIASLLAILKDSPTPECVSNRSDSRSWILQRPPRGRNSDRRFKRW